MDPIATEKPGISKKQKVNHVPAEKAERVLKWACLFFFVLLIVSQAIMMLPSVRPFYEKEALDGVSLGSEAYLYEPCKIELKLIDKEDCPELKVLVNGEEAGAFLSDTLLLELKEGDVVELDASELLIKAEVQVTAVSSNLSALLGKSFEVSGGIIKVTGHS